MNRLTLVFAVAPLLAFCQTNDTLIYAVGNIFNAESKEPVVANISYQSLPYGNRVGILKGSNFSFPLFDNDKYEITIEAIGYAPAKYMLDPAEANEEKRIVKDIALNLPATAAKAAETAHHVGKVMRLDNLIFAIGKSDINPSSFEELNTIVKMLQDNPDMVIQLEGHTDNRGNAKDNMKLSQERVDAVKKYLVTKGINKTKIKTKAFGGTHPLSNKDTEEAHRLNRRVEVRILEN